ncbi:IF factor, partial [Rhinopomastus cyanomelas]|nr:IF factor [Rhinopomastus cyanomelas]
KNNGLIGNIYDMGLVLQALEVSGKFYAPQDWDCKEAFAVVSGHDYHQPTAIAQLLPALVDRPYMTAGDVKCPDTTTSSARTPNLQPTPQLGTLIKVHYNVTNRLQGQPFSVRIDVEVPEGSTVLEVMEEARRREPETFSFKTEPTSWGAMVVSIHGVAANTNDRTYWQFLNNGVPIPEGVATYRPHNEDNIEALFSTY